MRKNTILVRRTRMFYKVIFLFLLVNCLASYGQNDSLEEKKAIENSSTVQGTIKLGSANVVGSVSKKTSAVLQKSTSKTSKISADTQPPTLICPPNQKVQCGTPVPDFFHLLTVSDDSPGIIDLTQYPGESSYFYDGMQIEFTATDASGNVSRCTITANALTPDIAPPTFDCPVNPTLNCDGVLPNYPVLDEMNVADNCSNEVYYIMTPPAGTIAYNGMPVHIEFTDEAGNKSNCNFTVRVVTGEDTTKPFLFCYAGIEYLSCADVLPDYRPKFTNYYDNCGSVTLTQTPPPGSPFVPFMDVTVEAKDGSGNTASCTMVVFEVPDTVFPTLSCIGNQTLSCGDVYPDYRSLVTASDNCTFELTQFPLPGSPFSDGRTVTITAKDTSFNRTVCEFIVNKVDTTPPTITVCASNQTQACGSTLNSYTHYLRATDNCDAFFTYSQSPPAGTPFIPGMTVTLYVHDKSGNTSSCSIVLNASDDRIMPIVTCPGDQILSCGDLIPDYRDLVTVTDNCDPNPRLFQQPTPGTPFVPVDNPSLTQRTIYINSKDASGNISNQCTFKLTKGADTTAPVIECPAIDNLICGSVYLPNYKHSLIIKDNCDLNPIITQTPPEGTPIISGMTVTVTAKDASGNSSTCSFIVNSGGGGIDTVAPTISCSVTRKNLDCGLSMPDYRSTVTVSDNCTERPTITQVPEIGTKITSDTTVVLTATDASGNSSSCSFPVTALPDTYKPHITVPRFHGVYCTTILGDYTSLVTAIDYCDANLTISQSPPAGSPFLGTTHVTLTATDDAGNFASEILIVILDDDIVAPSITCIGNQILTLGSVLPDYTSLVTATDNCDPNPRITQSPAIGSPFVDGMTITITAQDVLNNTETCTFKVTTSPDTIKPVVVCIGNQTLNCGSPLPDYTSLIMATDDKDPSPTIAQSPVVGSPFVSGMTITMTAKDNSNNESTCSFIVNASGDTTKPVITCLADQTLACGSVLPDYTKLVTVTDNCDASPIITQSPAIGSPFVDGMTITITAKDTFNNSSACSFKINTAPDTIKPIVTCVGNQTLDCGSKIPDYTGLITATDNCDTNPIITQSPATGSNFVDGMTITITVTDASGNFETCTFKVNNSVDIVKPVIICAGNQTLACGSSIPDYITLITATDNCDASPIITQSPVAGSPFVAGMTITMTAKDSSNNEATCSFKVNPSSDVTKPVITCLADQNLACGSTIPDYTTLISVTDNCDASPVITQSPVIGTPFVDGMTITITAKDVSNNTENCSFKIYNAVDIIPPVVICSGDKKLLLGAVLPDYTSTVTATDNCDTSLIISQNPIVGTSFVSGMTVVISAKDASGNIGTCSFIIDEIEDAEPPLIQCLSDQNLVCSTATIPDYSQLVTVSDNKDANPIVTQNPIGGSPFVSGMTVTMTAKDISGNSSTCNFTINAFADVEKPVVTCIADQILDCNSTIPDYTALILVTDNCDPNPIITQSPAIGTTFVDGMTITMTVKDASNNVATCSFIINVSADVIKPIISCIGNQSLACNSKLPDYTKLVTVNDNCDASPILTQSPAIGTAFVDGMTVTITAKDVSGNSSTCSFTINLSADVAKPVINCIGNQSLACGSEIPNYTKLVTVTDNCDASPILTQSPVIGTPFVDGMTITITAKDVSGNSSNCSFKVQQLPVYVSAGSPVYIIEREKTMLNATSSGEGFFSWAPSNGLSDTTIANPVARPLETTTYTVTYVDLGGCMAKDNVTIYVTPELNDDTKYGFSPNDDGVNDFWTIDTIEENPNNEVFIYNRWGDLVFQIKNYNNTNNVFSGIANRKRDFGADVLPEGTYFFDIKIEGTHHLKKTKGFLVLKR